MNISLPGAAGSGPPELLEAFTKDRLSTPVTSPRAESFARNNTDPVVGFPQLPDVTYIDITVTVLCCFVFVLGVVGNLLVVLVVTRNVEMRTPTNWFLVNLSVADLLVLLICMPSSLVEMHAQQVWLLGDLMCKMVPYMEHSVIHCSVLTILAISFERYYAMCYPLEVLYTCTTRRAMKILLVVWIVALASALPFPFTSKTVSTYHVVLQKTVLECINDTQTKLMRVYLVVAIVVFFVIPLFLLVLLYGFIGRQLARESAFATSYHDNDRMSVSQTSRTRRQVIIMLAIIITLFFICLLPMRVFILWSLFTSRAEKEQLGFESYLSFLSFSRIMLYLNSAINPVVYNMVSTKFRTAFLRATCRRSFYNRRLSSMPMAVSRPSFLTRTSMGEVDSAYRTTAIE